MSVKLREKRGKLYLDIYQAGKRTWEALHLSVTNDKAQNKEVCGLPKYAAQNVRCNCSPARGILKTPLRVRFL